MWSGDVIRQMSDEAAARAAARGAKPYVPFNLDEIRGMGDIHHFPFPCLGTLVPAGWRRVSSGYEGAGVWFVDKSGHGGDDEPAMTHAQFRKSLEEYYLRHPDHGFAIFEEGPCQVYIAAYRPVRRRVAQEA